MAKILFNTINNENPHGKPKIYFTCHPDDFALYFDKICRDIFKTHDCAIFFTENMNEYINEVEKDIDIGSSNLLIVPVTFNLLTTKNRAMDEDIPYAKKTNMPILPLMMETGVEELYSSPYKFGELQYLNPFSEDITEISYQDKLKNFLETIISSDNIKKRIQNAFDAYIFLSYRKTDRIHANNLIKMIHNNPECRNIAIWYDEFLTPGESFKENIEKILDNCELFALVITPQLFKKSIDATGCEIDNYVISTELPTAREKNNLNIFAVEMEETDVKDIKSLKLDDYVSQKHKEEFRTKLLSKIKEITFRKNKRTPEHNFLVGLAYLEGIDTDVNRELGISMIEEAASSGLIEAIKKIVSIYKLGNGAKINYEKAIYWQEELIKYCSSDEPDFLYAYSLLDLARLYQDNNDFKGAEKSYLKAIQAFNQLESLIDNDGHLMRDLTVCHMELASLYCEYNFFDQSEHSFNEAKKIASKYLSICNHEQLIFDLVATDLKLSQLLFKKQHWNSAKKILEESYELLEPFPPLCSKAPVV